MNPYGEYYYDGITLNPFEVMFVKTKEVLLANEWTYAILAEKYDSWIQAQASTCGLGYVLLPSTI